MFVFNYQQNLTQVAFNCIICCNILLDPVFKDKKLRWQLLIPISLIQTLDSEHPVKLQAVSNTLITKKKFNQAFLVLTLQENKILKIL